MQQCFNLYLPIVVTTVLISIIKIVNCILIIFQLYFNCSHILIILVMVNTTLVTT
jgi:hypothetical protein